MARHLLTLPNDILLNIGERVVKLRYAVVVDGRRKRRPPAILRTCRHLRFLLEDIYWLKNVFYVRCSRYDERPFISWLKLLPKHILAADKVHKGLRIDMTYNIVEEEDVVEARINLMAVLKGVWAEDQRLAIPPMRGIENDYDPRRIECTVHKLKVMAMRVQKDGFEWQNACRVLSLAIEATGVLGEDTRW